MHDQILVENSGRRLTACEMYNRLWSIFDSKKVILWSILENSFEKYSFSSFNPVYFKKIELEISSNQVERSKDMHVLEIWCEITCAWPGHF